MLLQVKFSFYEYEKDLALNKPVNQTKDVDSAAEFKF